MLYKNAFTAVDKGHDKPFDGLIKNNQLNLR